MICFLNFLKYVLIELTSMLNGLFRGGIYAKLTTCIYLNICIESKFDDFQTHDKGNYSIQKTIKSSSRFFNNRFIAWKEIILVLNLKFQLQICILHGGHFKINWLFNFEFFCLKIYIQCRKYF